MALKATKISATTVELDLNDYAGKTVNLTINWSSDAGETASVTYNIGTGSNSLSGSSDSFTTNAAGGRTYTFTHSSTLNDPDQDIRIDNPDTPGGDIASGTTVSWGFEDGGGRGSTGVGGGETDNDYNDGVISVTVNSVDAGSEFVQIGSGDKPDPSEWSSPIPTCASPPTLSSTSGGLQISKSGSNSVILNLRNYANKLVTLKVVHQKDAAWQNGFSFNIPNASDITAAGTSLGGSVYNRPGYSNSDISGTTTFYLYNLDGGDYNYTFSHSSVPGPVPTRTNYNEKCTTTTAPVVTTDGDGVTTTTQVTTTTCIWEAVLETYSGAWSPCSVGVALAKNGGNEVRWCYEDGGGQNYCDQTVTITVEDVRDAIPQSGGICMSDIKDKVWVADGSATGDCLSEYRDHSTKARFRIPSIQSSKTSLPDPLCFTDFRGIAGAKTPGEMGIP
jgi:hypothetical protein